LTEMNDPEVFELC